MKTKHATTKSGFPIEVIEAEVEGTRQRYAFEHPWLVRFTHWLNAITLTVMIGSGLQIFAAFPSFGDKIPQVDLLHVPAAMRLGGWLGGALQWHFTFAWLFVIGGVAYVIYQVVSGHWRQTLFMPKDIRSAWPMARHYFLFGPKPDQTEPYNALQKLAYTSTVFFGAAATITGIMLYKPVQFGWLLQLCGGFGLVRLWHFLAMCGFLSFIPGHLLMVALHGWNNFRSMLTGWKRNPEYLAGGSKQ